jgi:hypothetical protein
MKRIIITFIVLLSFFIKANAQININLQGGFGVAPGSTIVPALACQANIFNLQLTTTTYFLVQPDSTIYLRINDISNIEFPNSSILPNSSAANAHFLPLFHNTSSVVDTFRLDSFTISTPMYVNCDIIGNSSAPSSISQQLGLYNDGINLTATLSGDFNGTSILSNQIAYSIYFPFLANSSTNSTLEVDYLTHRLPNNRFERIVSYVNDGGPPDSTEVELRFNFSDLLDCSSFEFDSIQYYINNGAAINLPITVIDTFVVTDSITTVMMKRGDVLHIREVVKLKSHCFLNDCSDLNRTFNANLDWGCEDLCKNLLQQTLVVRGSLRPHLTINRIEPAITPSINDPDYDCYWDTQFSDQAITNFRFRLANRGSDVINEIHFSAEDVFLSNMYFVTDSNNIIVTRSFTDPRNFWRLSTPYDTVGRIPGCVRYAFPQSIHAFHFYVDYLMPNDSIDIIIPVQYCCPNWDNGNDPTVLDLFEEPKALNSWSVGATGKSGCNDPTGLADAQFRNPPALLNIKGNYFTLNSAGSQEPEQFYLKQTFIPNGISFSVPQDSLCSTPTTLDLNNYQFSQNGQGRYRWEESNLFTRSYSVVATDSIFVDSLFIQFQIKTEPGLMLDLNVLNYTMTNGSHTWIASTLSNFPDSCKFPNTYTITFSSTYFPFNNPAAPFLSEVYDMVNSGEFHFNIRGCCCSNLNNNPNYVIETLMAGYDYCFIPMYRVFGNSEIHCPGCNMPGTIVLSPEDQILERTNFGYTDSTDNGLAEFPPVRADSTYLATYRTRMDLNHSMVGDTLSSLMKVRIDDTSEIDLDSLASLGIYLKHLYAEQKIEYSNSDSFDIHPFQITITARNQSVTLTTSSSNWNQIVKDVRDSVYFGDKYDLVFYNLSTAILGNLFGISNYTFNSNEEVSLKVMMRVCKNFQPSRISKALADNQHRSKVSLNMYLTDMNLDSLGIYNAFSDQRFTIAQEDPVLGPNKLYMCETKSAMHYFYSIYAKSLILVSEDPGSPCIRTLRLDHEIAIGGDKINPFRFEFRPIPEFFPIQVTLPTGIGNYQFYNNGYANTYVRTNFTSACGIPSLHKSLTQNNLIFNSSVNYPHTIANERLLINGAFPPTCGSDFIGTANIFYTSDEYLKQTLFFPFTYTVCESLSSTSLNASSMTTSLNLTTCSSIPISVLNEISPIINYQTITSNYVNQIHIGQPLNVSALTHREKWSLRINNNYVYDRKTQHLFIYFNDTTTYSNIAVEGWSPQHLVLPNGKRIVYFQLDSIQGVAFDSTRSIYVDINDCTLDSIPFFVGFDCISYPTLLQLQNGTICQLDTGYLPLEIEEPRISALIDQNDSLTTCQIDTVNATCEIFGTNIYDFRFKMDILNPSTVILGVRILHHHNGNISSLAFSVIPPIPGNNRTYVPVIAPDSIQPGDKLELEIIYSMLDTATSSPFSVDYSYTNLCGDAGPPAVQDTVHHRPLLIGNFNCSEGVAHCFQVMASQNTINCVGSPISISSTAIGDTTGLTYQWTSNPVGFTGTGPSITPNSPSVMTTYTVVATDSLGTTSRDSVTVMPFSGQCCIPPGFSLANGDLFFNNATASTFVQQYLTNFISTAQKILIAGTFTVDTNFTFAGCPNLVMAPGALIDVQPNIQFIVDDSHMYSCGAMSRGINAQDSSSVRMKGSVIEDAQYAVNLGPNAELRSVANYFKNNYISINAVSSLPSNNPMSIQLNISNTIFESTRSLRSKYTVQAPAPLTHPFAGIYLSNITNVTIAPDTSNIFRTMNIGILSNRTTLNVSNCKFKDILNYDAYSPVPRLLGSAMYARGLFGTYTLTYTGERDSLSPDFENCINGVKGNQMSIDVSNSFHKNVDVGIESLRSNLADVTIENNTIECNLTGISLLNNLYASSLVVYNNEIKGGFIPIQNSGVVSSAIGIDLQGNNYTQIGVRYLVANNEIHLGEYGHTGIHANYSKHVDIVENLITIENDRNMGMAGIVMENSQQSTISCNDIGGTRVNQSNEYDESAIRYASSLGNVISQNNMNWMSQGIDVIGVCDNGIDQTTIEKNLIGFHFNGLRYRGSAVVNEQMHNGNRWVSPFNYPGFGAKNLNLLNAINFQYLVNGGGQSLPPNRTPSGWFVPDSLPDSLLNFSDCNNFGTSNPNPTPSLLKLSEDSIETIEFQQELNWQSKVNVYQQLIEHPEYLSNPDLADFYIINAATSVHFVAQLYVEWDSLLTNQETTVQNLKNNSIDIYEKSAILKLIYEKLEDVELKPEEVDSLLLLSDNIMIQLDQSIQLNDFYVDQLKNSIEDNIDLIGQLTDSIQVTEVYELNEQQISGIEPYLFSTNEQDSIVLFENTLYAIATQCPLTGGLAVFKARAILKELNPNIFYDDAFTCIQSGVVYRKKETIEQHCTLYPNPTSGNVTVSYSIPSSATLIITDAIGRILLHKQIDSQSTSLTIDLSKFQTGLYFYRIANDSDVRYNGKIILTR